MDAAGRALVVGESLVDIVERPDGRATEHPGGSPANVAVALARLGRATTFVTQYADDHFGSVLDAHLRREGVEVLAQPPESGRTSSARARVSRDGSASYEFDLTWDLDPVTVPVAPVVVHTGSLAAVLEPGARSVIAMLDALGGSATRTYDLNLRPTATGVAGLEERVRAVASSCDLVKASDEDLAHLHPGLAPPDAARRLLALGPAAVVVTLGAGGALCVAPEDEIEVPAPRVTVADTIGAGDAFCAGIIDHLWERGLLGGSARSRIRAIDAATWTDVLRHAAAVAAVTVTRPGADPPRRAELGAS